jgi:tetratricopeptide (TPR) repeat protein
MEQVWRYFAIVFIGIAVCGVALASNGWSALGSSHFRLLTSENASVATQALDLLERTHDALAQANLFRVETQAQVTILAFRSEAEFAPYRPQPGILALFQHKRSGDFIVLQSLAPENAPAAIHEYVHFLIAHSGLKLPLWLNEGLADAYSSIEFRRSGFVIGSAPAGRLESLQLGGMVPLEALFSADRHSALYNSVQPAYLFYAESWALVHMLMFDDTYSSGFPRFLASISAGIPAPECLHEVYGKNAGQVMTDLSHHIQRSMGTRLYPLAASHADSAPERLPVSEGEVETMLADVLAANPARQAEADARLTALSQRFPADPQPEESLGDLALRRNDPEQARFHFVRAAERNSKNPDVLYQAARLEQAAGAPDSQVIALLERLLAIQPENESARLNLAVLAARQQDYSRAVSALSAMHSVSPEDAFTYFYTLAYCQARLKRFDMARKQGRQALSLAASPDQQRQAENLLRYSDLASGKSDVTAISTPAL